MTPAKSEYSRGTLLDRTSQYPQIDRRSGLSLKEFYREYRDPGKPVVLTDATGDQLTFGFG